MRNLLILLLRGGALWPPGILRRYHGSVVRIAGLDVATLVEEIVQIRVRLFGMMAHFLLLCFRRIQKYSSVLNVRRSYCSAFEDDLLTLLRGKWHLLFHPLPLHQCLLLSVLRK